MLCRGWVGHGGVPTRNSTSEDPIGTQRIWLLCRGWVGQGGVPTRNSTSEDPIGTIGKMRKDNGHPEAGVACACSDVELLPGGNPPPTRCHELRHAEPCLVGVTLPLLRVAVPCLVGAAMASGLAEPAELCHAVPC